VTWCRIVFIAIACTSCWISKTSDVTPFLTVKRTSPPIEIPHVISNTLNSFEDVYWRRSWFSSQKLPVELQSPYIVKTPDARMVMVVGGRQAYLVFANELVHINSIGPTWGRCFPNVFENPSTLVCLRCIRAIPNDPSDRCQESRVAWYDIGLNIEYSATLNEANVGTEFKVPQYTGSDIEGITYLGEPILRSDRCTGRNNKGEVTDCTKSYIQVTTLGLIRFGAEEAKKRICPRKPLTEVYPFIPEGSFELKSLQESDANRTSIRCD
jgi:hypothetical protein